MVQAVVLGLCVGLFVATAAEANDRTPVINTVLMQVLVAGALAGGFFYAGLTAQQRGGWSRDSPGPPWLYAVYTSVWVAALVAALVALFGAGGFKVAALAIVPLVLLAPSAAQGFRLMVHRRAGDSTGGT